jgi:hypothetical protein
MSTIEKLSHRTTRDSLASKTKEQIVDLILGYEHAAVLESEVKRMTKPALIDTAMECVALIVSVREAQAKIVEDGRLAVLDVEKRCGKVATTLAAVKKAAFRRYENATEVLTAFEIECKTSPAHAIIYNGEQVLKATAELKWIHEIELFLNTQIDEQIFTSEQIGKMFTELAGQYSSNILDDGYRHNSTCAMSNINNMAEFYATQRAAVFFTNLTKMWNDVLDGKREVVELAYGYDRLMR